MTESAEQKSLMRWWHMSHRGLGVPDARLLFAIPNGAFLGGGKLGARRGGRLKGEGLVAGVPDLFLAVPRGEEAGLFIEMKRSRGGVWRDDQQEMAGLLINQGYGFVLCYGWEEAAKEITEYLAAAR